MGPRISIRRSVRPSVGPIVCNAYFLNPRERLFSTAKMDGIGLVVTRGDEEGVVVMRGAVVRVMRGGAVVTRGDEGVWTHLTFGDQTC